jgi:hypothetical protein
MKNFHFLWIEQRHAMSYYDIRHLATPVANHSEQIRRSRAS